MSSEQKNLFLAIGLSMLVLTALVIYGANRLLGSAEATKLRNN